MEAIVSLLILGILMTTIVSIIRFSLVMTGISLNEAAVAQTGFNDLIHEDYPSAPAVPLTFTLDFDNPFINIEASHNVILYNEENTLAFMPDLGSGGG